jgi:hypothetical protein
MPFSLQRKGSAKKVSDLDVCSGFDSIHQIVEVTTEPAAICTVLVNASPVTTIAHCVTPVTKTLPRGGKHALLSPRFLPLWRGINLYMTVMNPR